MESKYKPDDEWKDAFDQKYADSEKRSSISQRKLSILLVVTGLPFWYFLWKTDFIFADNGPRTWKAWLAFPLWLIHFVTFLIFVSRARQKENS